jgi:hypothetical protein
MKDKGEYPKIQAIVKKFSNPIYSLDVGTRNGEDGNFRLLYYKDPDDPEVAYVTHLFIDTH